MTLQIFGTKKCRETEKAIRFFKERAVQVQFIDLAEKKISAGELSSICKSIKSDDLIDKESREFKKLNLAYIQYDAEKTILEHPLVLKTPICRSDKGASSGYAPEIWKSWL
jgi:arsenate reductase (glutaredoxin)